jgi:uncharacterized membrane protein HdeD (DUF308 family)
MIFVFGSWQSLAVRGGAAAVFGIAGLVWPGLTLWALVVLFGAWVLVDGGFALWAAIAGSGRERRWLLFVEGIAGIAAGIITFVWPNITALALLYLIAAWALVTGILKLVAAAPLRHGIRDEWLPVLSGLLSIVFAIVLVITPGAGALVITWLIGWFALILGVALLALAFRLRLIEHEIDSPHPVRPAAA